MSELRTNNDQLTYQEAPMGKAARESIVSITDVLCEGPIFGLIDGTSSVFLNNTSMKDARLRTFSPIITVDEDDSSTITSGTITFPRSGTTSGSSSQGTVSGGSPIPSDLTMTSGDTEYVRHLGIRNLHELTLTQSGANNTIEINPAGFPGGAALAATVAKIVNPTPNANDIIETASNNLKDALLINPDGMRLFGTISKSAAGAFLFTTNVDIEDFFAGNIDPLILRIRRYFPITAVDGQHLTVTGTVLDGTYEFTVGEFPTKDSTEVDINDNVPVSKFNDVNIQFRDGSRSQLPLGPVQGVGAGTGINASFGTTLLQGNATVQQLGGTQFTSILDDTNDPGLATSATFIEASDFSLSATQIQAADELVFSIQYPSGLRKIKKSDGTDYQQYCYYHFSIQFTFKDFSNNSVTSDFLPLYQSGSSNNPGRYSHTALASGAIEFQHKISFAHYRAKYPFTDFKVRIIRLSPVQKFTRIDGTALGDEDTYADLKIPSILSRAVVRINDLFRYPHTAHANVAFSSRNFNQLPQRSYDVRGMLVKIPSTYTPRESNEQGIAKYQGFWDGTFKDHIFYTDNPAWIFFDIVTNKRYGAGEYLTENDIDKYDLYRVARYCDEIVEDGTSLTVVKGADADNNLTLNRTYIIKATGNISNWSSLGTYIKGSGAVGDVFVYDGTTITTTSNATSTGEVYGGEPRFRMNIYLSSATDMFKVLKDMASMFTSMLYWMDGKLATVLDAPGEPVYNFTKGNVIGGQFSYESTARQTRFNQIVVTFNNPDFNFQPTPVIVEDREAILRDGRVFRQEAVAFGCTSEAQAIRYGRWKLFTTQNQKELVSFDTALAAQFLRPGDIINVQDADRSGVMLSGRIKTVNGGDPGTGLTLDRSVTFNSGSAYTLLTLVKEPAAYYAGVEPVTINGVTINRGDRVKQAYVYTPIAVTTSLTNGNKYKIVTVGNTDFTNLNTDNDVESIPGEVFVSDGTSGSGTGTIVDLTTALTLTTITTEAQASNAYTNANGTELLPLKFSEHSNVETNAIVNPGSASNTVTIASSGQFTTNPAAETVWALKEVSSNLNTTASAKQYKILSIAQSDKNIFGISAIEHFEEKYAAVDEDYSLAQVPETTFVEKPVIVPQPKSVSVHTLERSSASGFVTIRVSFEPPDNAEENDISSYELVHNVEGKQTSIILQDTFEHLFHEVAPGDYYFRVRSISGA